MGADQPLGLAQIGQIAILVQDLGRAVAFYRDKLKMQYLFSASTLAFFDCAGVRLMLSMPEPGQEHAGNSIIYFKVDDIDAAYGELSARGVQFDDHPHIIANMGDYDLWMAFLRDSEHNLLGIMSEVAHDAAQ
ncbi:MAG TPA: VOC family protein [Roseiflexaceae bacterium]|nr:VOC family protein [Roseiflexaceae bacterium]